MCINQDDKKELGHQVAIMGEVYGNAKRVLICVGPDPEGHANAVVSLVADVNAMMDRSFANIDLTPDSFPWLEPTNPLMSDPRWSSFKELLQVTWCHRGWCIQEAMLAATAQVMWGEIEISWELLGRAHHWLLRRAQPVASAYEIRMSDLLWDDYKVRREVEARTLRHESGYYTYSLLEIMSTARRMGITDKRDRVYAFLGLHQARKYKMREYMQVGEEKHLFDYNRTFEEVYHDFAAGYLQNSSDLSMLQYVEQNDESLAHTTPSWVPRWDLHMCAFAIPDTTWPILQSSDNSSVPPVVLSKTEVRVRGVIFDKLRFTSDPHPSEMIRLESAIASLGAFWSTMLDRQLPSAYALTDRAKHMARTLRVGRFRGLRELWDQHESAYIREICGRHNESHDKRGYGIDVEALAVDGDANFAHGAFRERLSGRKVVLTERGYFGLAPNIAQEGDLCAIIFGTRTPFLLRKDEPSGGYKILGEMYVESKSGGLLGREDEDPFLGSKDWIYWGLKEQDLILV
jgi:hypothetical protein